MALPHTLKNADKRSRRAGKAPDTPPGSRLILSGGRSSVKYREGKCLLAVIDALAALADPKSGDLRKDAMEKIGSI